MKTITSKFLTIAAALVIATTLSSTATIPDPVVDSQLANVKSEQTVVLAGGCFWGVQAVFEHVKGS